MDAKEYLSQAHGLNDLINAELSELDRMRKLCGCCDENMPPASLQKYMDELNRKIDSYIDLKEEIAAAIEAVPDPQQKLLLRYRYIDGYVFERIGEMMGFSQRQLFRIHNAALKNLTISESWQ